jgi:long-chain acyl-CoA synthetase
LYTVSALRDLKEMTDTACANFAHHDAFRTMTAPSEYVSITYAQFGQDICALANTLIEKGLTGKRIAVLGENSYFWVLAYVATVNINATIVTLDKELSQETLLEQAKRADTCVLFFSNTFTEEAAYIKENIPGITTVSFKEGVNADFTLEEWLRRGNEIITQGNDRYSGIPIDRERTCTILFTSGTTGASKGVMLSHRSLASNIVSAAELILFKPEDVLLSVLPVHHTWEAMGGILGPVSRGCAIAFCESIKMLPACLKLFKPTIMVLVPLYVETFNKKIWDTARKKGKEGKLKFGIALCNALAVVGIDLRRRLLGDVLGFFGGRIRSIPCGGAPLNPELVKSFKGFGITIQHGYGTTECSPIVSANGDLRKKPGSDGFVFSCCKVRISESGEILVKGDNLMNGYLDDEQATAQAFDGEWYKTGDLGYVDKDGFLYVTGRCKNLIVLKNGKNISPEEIENKISSLPYVTEVLVKEEPGNEYLVAQIYPNQEALKSMGEDALKAAISEEIDRVNQKLAPYKRVRRFELRNNEFPKTTKRSIMRHKVKGEK